MIQEFSVKNFRSIKEKQTLSFVANKRYATGFEEHLCVTVAPGVELLKLALLYGYNASGKSNMILALDFLRDLILEIDETTEKAIEFTPFLFDEEYKKSPGEFSMTFFHEGIKYQYSISVDSERIYDEELIFWPHGRPSLLFERHWDAGNKVSKIKVGSMISLKVADKRILEGNTLEHRSVIAAYRQSNIHNERLEEVKNYFMNNFMPIINPKIGLWRWHSRKFFKNSKNREMLTDFLKRADLQISDLEIREFPISVDEDFLNSLKASGFPEKEIKHLEDKQELEGNALYFIHETTQGSFDLPAEEESDGTLRYFGFTGIVMELLKSNHAIAIYELETSLHPDLVNYLIEIFLINSKGSQIFATTHAQYLMENEYVRRDMVWFCEKGGDGGSEYYSAQDFGLHKNHNLGNFYRAGKLGGVPVLGSPLIEGEEDE